MADSGSGPEREGVVNMTESSASAEHGRFRQSGKVYALCRDDGCPWKYVTNTLGGVNRAAVAHVEETGHDVQVERSQWKVIRAGVARG